MIIDRISAELGANPLQIWNIVHSANYLYRYYPIEKRNGQTRNIFHPSKRLKVLQRWVANRIFKKLPVHPVATAYIKGTSIRDNAVPHANSQFIQKLDFENFFESITGQDIRRLLTARQDVVALSQNDINVIVRIVSRNDRLTIGAPSSPTISNAILFDFDTAVSTACQKIGLSYSRYADDLTFSCAMPDTVGSIVPIIEALIANTASPRLKLNAAKTISVSKKHRRMVTGLTLTTDGRVSVGRARKREARALIHQWATDGLPSEIQDYLRGLLAFINSAEPEAIASMQNKYEARYNDNVVGNILALGRPFKDPRRR